MNQFRSVLGMEFEITPQVRYNAAFMSLPEFVNYYTITQGHKPNSGARIILQGICKDLVEDAIQIGGIDRSFRKSSLAKWREENYIEPEPIKHSGRGRPKGSKNK